MLAGTFFPTSCKRHERLDSCRALAVFVLDSIGSNAYATEAITSILRVIGSGALRLMIPISLGILITGLLRLGWCHGPAFYFKIQDVSIFY
jgi:hypothetical protein